MKLFKVIKRNQTLDELKIAASYINVSLEERDLMERTLLHCATEYGRADMVRWLLAKKLSPNAVDSRRATPLHLARSREIILLLRSKGALDLPDKENNLPIHKAVKCDNWSVLDLFANTIEEKSGIHYTPLMLSVFHEKWRSFMTLLKMGANVNSTSVYGPCVLLLAMHVHVDFTDALVEFGASPSISFDQMSIRNAQIVSLLQEMGIIKSKADLARRAALLKCMK